MKSTYLFLIRRCWLWLIVWMGSASMAQALILQGAEDESFNTTAPTGIYEGSGWQYQGHFGGGLGTAISPTQFITAAHLGVASTFVFDSMTYNVNTSNVVLIAGTDLMIMEVINGTFGQYAAIYDGPLTSGIELVSMGRGAARGNEYQLNGDSVGWLAGGGYGQQRWGVNRLDNIWEYDEATYLVAGFDLSGGGNEFGFIGGDSGGGTFVYDSMDERWELVGVNYAVSGPYRNDPLEPLEIYGAFYDTSELYEWNGTEWVSSPNTVSLNYMTSVTSKIDTINAVLVPEPGSGMILISGLIWWFWDITRKRQWS